MPQLREVSRQEYLKKREEQKIAELEDALRDEELLFACEPSLNPPSPIACHAVTQSSDFSDQPSSLLWTCTSCRAGTHAQSEAGASRGIRNWSPRCTMLSAGVPGVSRYPRGWC